MNPFTRAALGMAVLLHLWAYAESRQEVRFVAGNTCISIDKTQQTRFVAPVVNGKPDLKHGHLEGVHATVDTSCGRIEIIHVKE